MINIIEPFRSWWSKQPLILQVAIILFFLLVIFPFFVINSGIKFSNWLFQVTGLNLNAYGLGNLEWIAFLGNYFGGVATVAAVWWTVSQTERHFIQTTLEQKRQNVAFKEEQERQRRLDVLPLILLQPRITLTSSGLGILIYQSYQEQKEVENKDIPLDEIDVYGECDMSEMTVVFGPKPEIRQAGPTVEEWKKVKALRAYTFLRSNWFINAGRESSVNIRVNINRYEGTLASLPHVFSLMPNEKIKLYFLVDIDNDDQKNSINGEYQFIVTYNDIYANQYCQKHSLFLNLDEQPHSLTIDVRVSQELIPSIIGNNSD